MDLMLNLRLAHLAAAYGIDASSYTDVPAETSLRIYREDGALRLSCSNEDLDPAQWVPSDLTTYLQLADTLAGMTDLDEELLADVDRVRETLRAELAATV